MCRYYVILVMPYVIWVFVADHSLDACKKLFRSPVALAVRPFALSLAIFDIDVQP